MRVPRSGSRSSMIGRSAATAACEPSTLAWKSHRSVCEKKSSSPVIFVRATSSSSPAAPPAVWIGSKLNSGSSTRSLQFLHVGEQLVGDRVGVGLQALRPQVLLQAVESGPLLPGLHVGLTQVDARVEVVGERLRDRLDPLVVGARRRELLLRRLDVAGLHRRRRTRRSSPPARRPGWSRSACSRRPRRRAGCPPSGTDSGSPVTVKSARMPSPTMPGLQAVWYVPGSGSDTMSCARQPRADVLHLAHHPVALGVDVELGHLGAVVGDLERRVARRRLRWSRRRTSRRWR